MNFYTFIMRFTFMGTGTSHGIPVIACTCAVCTNSQSKDKRLRCSAYVTSDEPDGKKIGIVIDTGPEFRIQALKYGISSLRAVLLTHSHADHLNGLDDIRIFSHTKYSSKCKKIVDLAAEYPETQGEGIPIYANESTIADARSRFDYIFKPTQIGGGKPKLCFIDAEKHFSSEIPLKIGSLSILPIPIMHGTVPAEGWLLSCTGRDGKKHSIAYLTDCNYISESSLNVIRSNMGILDHLVIDALRQDKHSTHCSFLEAMQYAQQLEPQNVWFTHICHDNSHEQIEQFVHDNLNLFPKLKKIAENGGSIGPAWDGLEISAGE